MALAKDRNTPQRDGELFVSPVAAGAVIHAGGLTVLNAGNAEPGSTATGLVAVGRADEAVDNTGGLAGAKTVTTRRGVFQWTNSGADPITRADIGSMAYIVDDETVARTNGTNTRSPADEIVDVDDNGVWVKT